MSLEATQLVYLSYGTTFFSPIKIPYSAVCVCGLLFLMLGSTAPVSAATLYWVGDDGANASVATNWKTTNPAACGSGDASAAPSTADTMNFDADCDNGATIDADFGGVVSVVTISSGYGGTITLARSLQTTSTFTTSGGIFDASNQTLDVDSTFTMNTGSTVRASSGTMTFASTFDINGGAFDKDTNSGGTVTFDGSSATLSCNSIIFNLVIISAPTVTDQKTVNSNCSLPLGANPTITRVFLSGTLSGTGTLSTRNNLNLSSGATLFGFSGLSVTGNFIVSGATADLSSYTSFSTSGTVTVSSGSFTLPSGADLNGALTISGGTLTAPSDTMTVFGNFTHSSGTFTANSGTVILDGNNQTLSGTTTFFNLTKTVTTARTLTFPASTTTTIAGTLTLKGSSGNRLSLRSSTTGTQWSIDPQGPRVIEYVDVRDSNNSSSVSIPAGIDSFDSGNNTGWSFTTKPLSFELDSPSDQAYLNSERPTFRWKAATTNSGSSIATYAVYIDNGGVGNWGISGIPASPSQSSKDDYVYPKYTLRYENFNDNDSGNNYISLWTSSSSQWNQQENDGQLKEGKRTWMITTSDHAGNTYSLKRDIFIDLTAPTLKLTQVNNVILACPESDSGCPYQGGVTRMTTSPTLTIFGSTTDSLSGTTPVVSGPHTINVTVEQQNQQGKYEAYDTTIITLQGNYFTTTNQVVTNPADNTSDKYSSFEFTPAKPLNAGTYQLLFTPIDTAGNKGAPVTLLVTIANTVSSSSAQGTQTETIYPQPAPAPTATPPSNSFEVEKSAKRCFLWWCW